RRPVRRPRSAAARAAPRTPAALPRLALRALPPRAYAEPVTQRLDVLAAGALQHAQAADEARTPLAQLHGEAGVAQHLLQRGAVAEADVRRVLRQDQVVRLQ